MTDLVTIESGKTKTTSKIIADVFGKAHRKVLRDIESLDCSDEFRAANFGRSSYTSLQNKVLECYDITRDGFCFLAMGFTGKKAAKWKEAYINAFNEMEKGIVSFDSRIDALSKEDAKLIELGRDWGRLGCEIKQSKKEHALNVAKLVSEVQFTIGFNDD